MVVLLLLLQLLRHHPQESKGTPRVPHVPDKSVPPWVPLLRHREWKGGLRTLCVPDNALTLFPSTNFTALPPGSILRQPYPISSYLFPYSWLTWQEAQDPQYILTLSPIWLLPSFFWPHFQCSPKVWTPSTAPSGTCYESSANPFCSQLLLTFPSPSCSNWNLAFLWGHFFPYSPFKGGWFSF